ncbi:hypothetical protein DL766_001095 [Monosporascus sp. MC13-8B]|nr:hypothetical protein DL763_008873 [Monosporascus cannonballus]RYP38185.1 hypothetical protein DL766_001095 [Monosporascus sp. MC13-8B]
MAKGGISKKARAPSKHSRSARRATSPSIDTDKSLKDVKPPAESINHRPSILAIHHGAGVSKKAKKARNLSSKARRRQEKAQDRAAAVIERTELKVAKSKGQARTIQTRRKAWDDINVQIPQSNKKSDRDQDGGEEDEDGGSELDNETGEAEDDSHRSLNNRTPKMPPKRMTANPQKPARYRAGKPTGASSSSSGSDSEASDAEVQQKQPERKIAPPPKVPSAGKIVSNLGKVDLNARRREEEQEAEDRRKAAERAARAAVEQGFVTEDEEGEEDDDDEEEQSGEEEEESSEDEAPRRPLMLKPKFVPKSQRGAGTKDGTPKDDDEAARRKAEEEEDARRKKAMDELVEEQLRKDALARAAGKKHWDDQVDEDEDVDTEDDKDPEAEYAAWKLRELRRIKREREAIEAREAERAEVERRRNLTEEERRAEDEEFLARQRAEKEGRGRMGYLQKYHHRGAFYRGDDEAEALASRDVMGARFEDDVANRELLPKALQLRDMTKLGRKGATKYRDLKTEDTGRWADFRDTYGSRGDRGRGGFDAYNVDERFKSDRERERGGGGASGPGGANAIPLGERKDVPGAPRGPGDSDGAGRRDNKDRYRDRDRERDRDRNAYRPSKARDRDDYYGSRKRDSSREAERYESGKRRRIDAR